jgi:hypothetical protein
VPGDSLCGDEVGARERVDGVKEVLERQLGERGALHMHESHGVQGDFDAACLGRHGVGVLVDRAFVQRVDLRDLDTVADVSGHRVERCARASREEDVGA